MTSFTGPSWGGTEKRRELPARAGMVHVSREARQDASVTLRGDGRGSESELGDRAGDGADAPRAGADGGRVRPGLPPPGTALRRGPRLLRDGELRRAPSQERAHARLSAHRAGRAAARGADLRL